MRLIGIYQNNFLVSVLIPLSLKNQQIIQQYPIFWVSWFFCINLLEKKHLVSSSADADEEDHKFQKETLAPVKYKWFNDKF